MDLNALLQLLSQHMGGGSANNPFASLMKLISGSGLGGPVNALNSGGSTGNVFANVMGGQSGAPPSIHDIFGKMLGNGTTSSMPSMGQDHGAPWNMQGMPTNALGSPPQSGFNPRLQFFGGGAGGIYPQQGQGYG